MLEVWSEGKAPTYSVQTTGLKSGTIDHGGISWSRYGGNVGVWRVIRAFNHFKLRGTFAANAMCAEIFPEAVAQIVKSGHDICGHGIWQDQILPYMTPPEQQSTIRRCLQMFEKATGKRPEGWKSPVLAFTPETIDFLVQEGVLWYADRKDIDLPCVETTQHGSLIAIPTSEFNDNRTLRGSPRDFYDAQKNTFDYLYRHEPTSLLNVTVHCHWGGRPPIIAMIYELFEYFSRFPDVWFTSSGEIARWVKNQGISEVTYAQRHFS